MHAASSTCSYLHMHRGWPDAPLHSGDAVNVIVPAPARDWLLAPDSSPHITVSKGGTFWWIESDAAMQCVVHLCCNGDKVIKVLEQPVCLCCLRPDLIAQVNAQDSPQFERLRPYHVHTGCCKVCKDQVCLPVPSCAANVLVAEMG
jgi:hypothetical protein